MSSNLVNQSPEDQFLHWRQDMERKQEEQTRKMKELQSHVERLQCEIGESRDLRRGIINKVFFKACSFNICNSPLSKVQTGLISSWHSQKSTYG